MNVIVTGASRGIGKAIAEIFAANGCTLFLGGMNAERLNTAVMDIEKRFTGISVKGKAADLSVKENAIEFAQWVLQHTTPDILINNAGRFLPGNTFDEAEGMLEQQINTNLMSAYHITRTLLPAMMKAGKGHIFNICSVASLKAYSGGGSYSISKFALHGFTQNIREEMKQHNIKVTGVYPGAVFTDSWGSFNNSNNRIMEAADIAKMVYAASRLSASACVEEIIIRPQLGDL